jgi:hypothetical protein
VAHVQAGERQPQLQGRCPNDQVGHAEARMAAASGLLISFVAEVGLALWLLVRGVKVGPRGVGISVSVDL